jgi:6-phosphogluconate dehydrogenase
MRENSTMQLGMIGLGRMGANMVRRLLKGGHQSIVFDQSADAVKALVKEKAGGAASLGDFVKKLKKPRAVWLMVLADISEIWRRGSVIASWLLDLTAGDKKL